MYKEQKKKMTYMKTKRHIQTLVFAVLLFLAGGMVNSVSAVKYHILTLPFSVSNHNNTGNYKENIRVEALLCESNKTTIELPAEFKSPLATGFKYWGSVNPSALSYDYLYDYQENNNVISAKYYIYQCGTNTSVENWQYACLGTPLTEGADVSSYTDIYVTYEYKGAGNGIMELDGSKNYNISINVSGTQKFMCLNRSRNNRVSNANASVLTGEQLADNDFVVPENGKQELGWPWGSGDNKIWGPKGIQLGFKFYGEDPYNFTIMTSYTGKEVHVTDNISGDPLKAATTRPFAGATLFSKMGNDQMWFDASNDRHYKIKSGMSNSDVDLKTGEYKDYTKYVTRREEYNNASAAAQYDTWVGYYRKESFQEVNTYALLPNGDNGYMFVASKMNMGASSSTAPTINQPENNKYFVYNDNGATNKPSFTKKTLSSAYTTNLYEIKTYTVHVKTHGATGAAPTTLTATMKWSDAKLSDNPADHVPEALKRKYVTYKAYSDAGLTNEITKFSQVTNQEYWLDYTVSESSMPFEALSKTGNYQNARWYTMRMNGKAEAQNIAYKAESSNAFITSPTKGSNTNLHQGENSAEAMVAFMGDPYELKILNRKACEGATGNRFIGCATTASSGDGLTTDKTGSSDISTWEIVYDTESGNFVLRAFGTATAATPATPMYIGWGTDGSKSVTYSATESRIRVVELEKVTYTYHIMRNADDDGDGKKDIAVKASSTHDIGKMLKSWKDIPAVIRSPFLDNATVTYYGSSDDANNGENAITNAPYNSNRDIWVRYSVTLSEQTYNVRLNNEYLYTDGDVNIKSKTSITDGERVENAYQWVLNYSDPYHMTIWNKGKEKYVNVAFNNNAEITWEDTPSYFIAKSGALDNTYEVMAATGDGVDASATYYNIGRPSANTVKLYSQSSYQYGNAVLRFELFGTNATNIEYHLIDKAGKDLLQATTRQTSTDAPAFPPEFHSPLVSSYHYYIIGNFDVNDGTYTLKDEATELSTVGNNGHIYVTYDVNDLVNLKAKQMYLLKYEAGETFHQEDGSDGVNPTAQKAVYPYVNGDGNFFVYGQEQYNLQQEGASSTRTRWAWYVESDADGKGDPYHVKIKSRQTESYPITNSSEYNAYFMTYKPDGYSEVITTLGWPGMNTETATEYMVLGSAGQYQLVTTNKIGESRYVVDSFEQYWKTYDTIRRKLLKQKKDDYPDNDSDPETVQSSPCLVSGFTNNRTYLTTSTEASPAGLGWHSYEKWAYAKRWNGYNNGYSSEEGKHETKKGWEKIEHWYQTVKMGQGYFDFVKTSIDPVLILLDQHGFEIMRKPIPTSPDDPQKEGKYAAIRPYNSPMVKEYAFWATAKKRTGLHQYYALADRIGGDDFTSTDLTNLPPYNSKNVKDKKGNQNDQYVTYIVKEEYAQTYTPSDKSAKPFLIEQGTKYASTDGSTITKNDVSGVTDMKTHILNDEITAAEEWYVKPNTTIDIEMGYNDVSHTWTDPDPTDSNKWKNKNPNAYDHYKFKDKRVASYISDKVLTDSLGYFSFSNGFDPYNIQIQTVQASAKYMNTNATDATLEEGSMIGVYEDTPEISLNNNTAKISPKWYDSRDLSVTNATFMAVQDANGNMQLMPRFDHSTRMSEFGTLIAPTDAQVATTYTKLYRPVVYEYLIIDNDGHESLRYKTGGDMTPQIPDHFQSPLAKNFTYYAKATKDGDTYTIDKTKEIEGSLDGAELTNNTIYVRYEYDEEADDYLKILKGNWLTMQLKEKNTIYNSGIKESNESKPETIDATKKAWQWKFLETPKSTPDPYALYIYNRSQAAGTEAIADRFALLSHSEGDYALAKAGENTTYKYSFLSGKDMSTTEAASVKEESGFTPTAGTFVGKNSQVKLTDEVQHTFIYKVYTNTGVNAIDANQTQESVHSNDWKPVLPEAARTPLLNMDQYRYYEQDLSVATPDTTSKSLSQLYGLYEDIVYTHYTPYNPDVSTYMVPNERNSTSEATVAPGVNSNDAPVGLDGKRPYNIYWNPDKKIMKSGGETITTVDEDKELQTTADYEWEFEGDDPYAIKIKSVKESLNTDSKYIHEATSGTDTELSTTATPFMLLNKDGYNYGVFTKTGSSVTGATPVMLSGYGNELTTSDPTKFIPFALSTYKVIYHLMIKNIGEDVIIPYRKNPGDPIDEDHKIKGGTTLRDLKTKDGTGEGHIDGDYYQLGATINGKTYCYDAGHISLGDAFEVPQAFYRPNVSYDYYIDGVYIHGSSDFTGVPDTDMNNLYRGLKMTNLGDDSRLLGKIVWVNIVYNFMGGLDTNSGSDFVGSVADNKWYTFETSDATPMMADYTTMNGLKTVSGYATHYTNDYLWTPVGDPYGFKMYNRYMYKNLGEKMVMSSSNFDTDPSIIMVPDNAGTPYVPYLPANSVYELLATSSTTPGYFRIHPVVNKGGTQVYMKNVVSAGTGVIQLNAEPTDWTFGLSEEVMKPYYQAAGYIGGLNEAGKAAYDVAAAKEDPLERLMAIQGVVYNHDNNNPEDDQTNPNYIVHYTPGYYRLHSQSGSLGITTPRYMSGYTHAIERDVDGNGNESDAIPLHFYEVEEYDMNNPTFGDLSDDSTPDDDFTITDATRGDIPLVTVTRDPASIFQFTGSAGTIGLPSTVTLSTQGLNVIENKMGTGEATSYNLLDVGAGVSLLYTGTGASKTFLNYKQTSMKYDLKYASADIPIESARWCLKPVQKGAKAGNGEMALTVAANNGGDNHYYTTFYAPFDVLLTDNKKDTAYVVPENEWPEMTTAKEQYVFRPKKIGQYNTAENLCPESYRGNNQFIPAGTPVIIRTTNATVTMALPTAAPSSALTTDLSGTYLEQMLAQGAEYIFVFGRSYTHNFSYDSGTGEVTPLSGLDFDKGVGFYKNANTNRESHETKTQWERNNKYVYANKAYYRGEIASSGSSLNLDFENTEYIPVLFDDQGVKDMDLQPDGTMRLRINDGRAYDIQGRCVATEQEVSDGSWLNNVAPGMYIVNGKKFVIE